VSRLAGALAALLVLGAPVPRATAQTAVEAARASLLRYHENLDELERARVLLTAAAEREPDASVLATLAETWFYIGEFRARTTPERLAAWERGSEAGRRAVALAPRSERAHVWYALNSARWAETRGFMRAAATLSSLREEARIILELDPGSVEGNTLAGGLAAELPVILGGDRGRAEGYFHRALETDPRRTSPRLELARLYIATRRLAEAQRELVRVLDETAPSDLPYWTLRDLPKARAMLESIGGRPDARESP
jgi:tetratricopeptide (TPR) repeat protein